MEQSERLQSILGPSLARAQAKAGRLEPVGGIDALTYTYTGNQLLSVTDGVTVATDKPKGFYDGNTSGNDYSYDWNGNMLTDKNKNITTSIVYNHLNLPTKVVRSNGIINYLYDATGAKLSQVVTFGPTQKNTEYIGPWLFENNQLQFIQHPEGRIVVGEKKQLLVADGTSAAIATPTTNVTLSTVAISGETYIKVTPTVGVTLTKLGISKIGNTISVAEGERYTFRVKGYNNTTAAAALYVQGNTTDLLWPAATLQQGAASEAWVESMILIPAGVTQITFGVLYNSAGTATSTTYFYINDIEIIKENALAPDYQYHLKDHLGNVRLTFTANPGVDVGQATYEDANLPNEVSKFLRTENVRKVQYYMFDRTNGSSPSTTPGYSQRLSGGTNETWGLARSLSVMPGDKITAEVYAKYVNPNTGNTSNLQSVINNIASLIAAGTTSSGTVVDGGSFSTSTSSFPFATQTSGLPGKTSSTGPKAFLSWLVFDKSYNLIAAKSGYDAIDPGALETGTDIAHDRMFSPEIVIDRPGYVYIVISNEETTTPVDVYFDDFTVTQTQSAIVQAEDYYPFGLVFNSYSRENCTPQDYKYNGKEQQDELNIGWLDYGARMYQPELGRFFSRDRFAEKYYLLTPYHYGANNPLLFVDMNGDSLVVTGEQTATDKFKSVSDQGLGGFYTTNVGENGLVSLKATGKEGEMTDEQKAFYAGMSQATSLESPLVRIGLVESNNQVIVGSYELQQIDVDDVAAFGSDGPATAQGALIHEVAEQTYKQTMGLGNTKPEYNMAHTLAIMNENAVNGSVRGDELPSSSMTAPRLSFNTQYNLSSSGHLDIQYTMNGQSSTVTLYIRYSNVKSVSK